MTVELSVYEFPNGKLTEWANIVEDLYRQSPSYDDHEISFSE